MADSTSPLVLVEGMIEAIVLIIDDGQVNGGRPPVVEMDGLSLQIGEVAVGITVILLVVCGRGTVACLQGEVHHVLTRSTVVDDLWCPYMRDIRPVCPRIFRGEMHRGMCPMHQVGGLRHHDATVARPSIAAPHVSAYHIKHAILATQHKGVADIAGDGDG